MSRRGREHLDKALRALEARGATITGVEQNKHTKIAFETPNGAAILSVSSTPSDRRSDLNVASDIRRKLSEIASRRQTGPVALEAIGGEEPAPRVRQAPWPMRQTDRTVPAWAPGGRSKTKLQKTRTKTPAAAVDPAVKALEILTAMERIAISRLAAAAGRRGDRWESVIARCVIGAPYLRGQGFTGAGLSAKFRMWTGRCLPEKTKELWERREEFLIALSEIACGYADQMPERAKLMSEAWRTFEWVSGKCGEIVHIPELCLGWPPRLLPGRLSPGAYLAPPTKFEAALAALKAKDE